MINKEKRFGKIEEVDFKEKLWRQHDAFLGTVTLFHNKNTATRIYAQYRSLNTRIRTLILVLLKENQYQHAHQIIFFSSNGQSKLKMTFCQSLSYWAEKLPHFRD